MSASKFVPIPDVPNKLPKQCPACGKRRSLVPTAVREDIAYHMLASVARPLTGRKDKTAEDRLSDYGCGCEMRALNDGIIL